MSKYTITCQSDFFDGNYFCGVADKYGATVTEINGYPVEQYSEEELASLSSIEGVEYTFQVTASSETIAHSIVDDIANAAEEGCYGSDDGGDYGDEESEDEEEGDESEGWDEDDSDGDFDDGDE